ncbi:MAG: ATP-binding protein [Bryobacteraceae bacterium]
MSKRVQRSTVIRYSVSVLLVLFALALTILAKPLFGGKAPLTFFTLAVLGAAAIGGLGPGITTTLLSLGLIRFLFPDQIFSLLLAQSSLLSFVVLGFIVSLVLEKFRRTNAELQQAKAHLEHANRELSHRTEALARSNEELQRFAYALSHDLQTPLRTVRLHTEFLVDRNFELLSADDKKSAQFIVTGIERMQSMIKGLLDYSTATEDQGKRASTDCNAVLRVVLEDLRDAIEEANAIVTFDRLPVVEANRDRVTQVFSNLIGNALKYRGEKRPEIHISARAENQGWVFSIKDNGIGIDMGQAERIFRVFERLHSEDAYEGSGIGLAICRAIIQRHGGRIWVESEAGKGSAFSFTLPSAPDTSPGSRKREAVHSARLLSR